MKCGLNLSKKKLVRGWGSNVRRLNRKNRSSRCEFSFCFSESPINSEHPPKFLKISDFRNSFYILLYILNFLLKIVPTYHFSSDFNNLKTISTLFLLNNNYIL